MDTRIQTVSELAVRVAQDPALADKLKANPAETLASVAAPLQSDTWIYRMVVGALGLAVLLAVVGAIILAIAGKPIPELLTALGSGGGWRVGGVACAIAGGERVVVGWFDGWEVGCGTGRVV